MWLVADGIIRSDSLDHLTKDDAALLTGQYHLKTIIDLRTVTEINERPDKAIPGVEYIHIPLMEETTAGITKEQGTDPAAIADNVRHVFVADESYLRSAIEALNERWGNIDEFVKRLLPDTVSHK